MRIEKHDFTPLPKSQENKGGKSLGTLFSTRGPIDMKGRTLQNRVQKPREVTPRGKALSQKVANILKNIPGPLFPHSKAS